MSAETDIFVERVVISNLGVYDPLLVLPAKDLATFRAIRTREPRLHYSAVLVFCCRALTDANCDLEPKKPDPPCG